MDKINKTSQEVDNLGFDDEFSVPTIESLTHNPIKNTLERECAIQGNASFVLAYDESDQLTTVTKTVGTTSYQKTLTWADGVLTAVSVWSEV